MIWVDTISELDYYHRTSMDYCYCELLVKPGDLCIQGIIGTSSAANLHIYLYTPDGVTNLGEITSFFKWYIAKAPATMSGSNYYFVAKLLNWPATMCSNRCFILRVTVGNDTAPVPILFDKYTEQYCLHDCCPLADDIDVTGTGVIDVGLEVPDTVAHPMSNACWPLLRIEIAFDCEDRFTGDRWDIPTSTIAASGTPFAFTKVLNIAGTIKRKPRKLTRQISYNCRTQKTESIREYELQSQEQYPLWKADEIENMLHANHFWANSREYHFPGGTPFTELYPKGRNGQCKQYFRINLPLQDCIQYQIFGCSETCAGSTTRYIAIRDTGEHTFYDESHNLIGDSDDLMLWLQSRPDVTAAISITPALAVTYGLIVEVTGVGPSFVYVNGFSPANRVYLQTLADGEDMNALFGVTSSYVECLLPAFGTITNEDMVCLTPTFGTITTEVYCIAPTFGTIVSEDDT